MCRVIVKPPSSEPLPSHPALRAGAEAERQMAFYLHRAFADDTGVHVLHDLRLVDPAQPEHTGQPGVAQIDHLLIHRLGMFIVESKATSGVITVRPDGHGGDQWMRGSAGFPSPIRQAERQAAFLRAFLQRNRASLLGKLPLGLRTVMRAVAGTDQRGFSHMPIQIIAAISDKGDIERVGGWEPPSKPFRTFLCKADVVADHIRTEIAAHKRTAPLLASALTSPLSNSYGDWSMAAEEATAVAEFLAASHEPRRRDAPLRPVPAAPSAPARDQPRAAAPPPQSAPGPQVPTCQHCGSAALSPLWGKYGYYWKCDACTKTTTIPTVCSACGAQGSHGKVVRIRKDGPAYYRECEACGITERVC